MEIDHIFFRTLIENIDEGISLIDKDFTIIYNSNSSKKKFGFNILNQQNANFRDIVHPEDLDEVMTFLQQLILKPGESNTNSFRMLCVNGNFIWIKCIFTNLLDDPKINGIICNYKEVTTQNQAEDLLQESKQELSTYMHALDETSIVVITDEKGIIRHVNEKFCKISKYSREELIGQDLLIINSSFHDKAFIENLWTTIAKGEIWRNEIKNKAKDGSYYWVDTTIIPFLNKLENPYQYIAIQSDITDKKELQGLLYKANSLARNGGWEIDLINNTVHWSEITFEIHETAPDYIPDVESGINFYKEGYNRERIINIIEQLKANGTKCDEELQIVTAKGNLKWIRVVAEAEFIKGKCTRLYGSFQDIDTLKSNEGIVKKILEERNTILESIRDAFFAVDKDWVVTYWNNSAELVLHKTKAEALNNYLWDIFPESVNSFSHKKYIEAIETNHAVHFEDHYDLLNKWYEISAYPSEGGLTVYFKDITERKISELMLNDLNISLHQQAKELRDSNAELEQFAYVASHDLQEPLRMVTSFLTQLERKYNDILDEKGRKYIHFAVDGAKRMRQIILDLLEFSRVGRFGSETEEVNMDTVIEQIIFLYHKQIEEQNATITYKNLPTFHSYLAPIRQLFQNLISNALKYTDPKIAPKISITYKETDVDYIFAVKDNGIGIDTAYFEKIFIIFQRLHHKEEYSGTGMGLAITKKIVENLGGRIWLESKEGEGSTFYFNLVKR